MAAARNHRGWAMTSQRLGDLSGQNHQIVGISLERRISRSAVIRESPSTSAAAPMMRSAGSLAASCTSQKHNGNDIWLARGGGDGRVYRGEPVVAIGLAAAGDGEEFFLELASDGAGDASADLDAVHGADGRDFDRRADEEHFIRNVEHFARNDGFSYGDIQVFG